MMFYYLYLIIYLIKIIKVKSQNIKNHSSFAQKLMYKYYSEKTFMDYNINLQIIENNNIKNEILINTTNFSNNFKFEFLYSGKFLFLNDVKNDVSKYKNDFMNYILLINQQSIFNYYIEKIGLIKDFTKIIIIPKNLDNNNNIQVISKVLFLEHSIYLLKVEEDILNKLINIYNNNNYYAKIISKKLELFFNMELKTKVMIILVFLFFFIPFYKEINKKERNRRVSVNISMAIYSVLKTKIFILSCISFELIIITNLNGFYLYKNSFFMKLAYLIIIIFKSNIIFTILFSFSGIPLFLKIRKIYYIIIYFFCYLPMIFEIFYKLISSEKEPYAFYIGNLFIYIIIVFLFIFFTIKTLMRLFKLNIKLKKDKRYKIYKKAIKIKICITLVLSIALVFYFFTFFSINEYLYTNRHLLIGIEKNILMECLESSITIIYAILFLPITKIYGFNHVINIIEHKIERIAPGPFYKTNIPKPLSENKKKTEKFLLNIYLKSIIILKPKSFFIKNENDKKNLSLN